MMNYSLRAGFVFFAAAGLLSAVEVAEKPEIPQLPDSKYVGHDGTRPQPVKVKTAGAVAVQGPSDAQVLESHTNKTHPDVGPLRLQWHRDPIQFRNIWIRGLGEYDQTGG